MKKIISVLLAMVVLLFLFIGCDGNHESDQNITDANLCEFCETAECDNSCQDLDISLCEHCDISQCNGYCQDINDSLCKYCDTVICFCVPCDQCNLFPWECTCTRDSLIYPRPPFDISLPPLQSPRQGAVIIPRQGGAMLFPFPAAQPFIYIENMQGSSMLPRYLQGLVNDLGEVITQPQYDHIQNITDSFEHIYGVLAWRNEVVVHYDLYGNYTPFPFTARRITPTSNGRHWIVEGVNLESEFPGLHFGFSLDDPLEQTGIWDVEAREFVFPPTDSVSISGNGLFLIREYPSTSLVDDNIRTFYWCSYSDTKRDIIAGPWRVLSFCAYNGLFFASRVIDGALVEKRLDWNMNAVTNITIQLPDLWNYTNGHRYGNLFVGFTRPIKLYHISGELLYSATSDKSFVNVRDTLTDTEYVALANVTERFIYELWNAYTGEMVDMSTINGQFVFWDNNIVFENGEQIRLDLVEIARAVLDDSYTPWIEDYRLTPVLSNKDFIIVRLNTCEQFIGSRGRAFAIDWKGNAIEHPSTQFFYNTWLNPIGATAQQFFWLEHEGQRGIINSQGRWVFVAE